MGGDAGMDSPLEKAMAALHKDFSKLAGWEPFGYLGGPLPGEKSITSVPVYLTGRMLNGVRLLASHPDLPYDASPAKLIQHATFLLCSHLAEVLANKGTDYDELKDTLRYDKVAAMAQERQRKEATFRSILAAKEEELQEALRPPVAPVENIMDTILMLKGLALSATGQLQAKLSRLVLRNHTVERAVVEIKSHDPAWVEEHLLPWAEDVFPKGE